MAEFQELVRSLLSAGVAPHPDGKGSYVLSVDDNSLVSKHWLGDSVGEQELITSSVRHNTSAAYLLAQSDRLVIYISPESIIRAVRYDDEEDEWVEIENIPKHQVHPEGKLAAMLSSDARPCVFYQDPAGKLLFLANLVTSPTTLPANPAIGTPLSISIGENELRVFYMSAEDSLLHYVKQIDGGEWSDEVMAQCELGDTARQITVGDEESEDGGAFTAYILTAGGALMQVTTAGTGALTKLGTVDSVGKFIPGTSAESSRRVRRGHVHSGYNTFKFGRNNHFHGKIVIFA